jgi:hypothetical protein
MWLLLAVCMVLGLATSALAAPNPYVVKWSQPPDVSENALNVESIWLIDTPVVADDWQCTDDRPVTDIHWWGSYLDENGNPIEKPEADALQGFWFGIYTDVPAAPDNPFSHPGTLEWEHTNYFGGPDLTEWFYTSFENWQGRTEYKYAYTKYLEADDWFWQDPGENVYWLAIAAIMKEGVDYTWGWETSDQHWNDDAVRMKYGGPYEKLVYPDGHPLAGQSMDMAFEITTTVPIPAAVWLLGSGLIGLVGIRRKFSR